MTRLFLRGVSPQVSPLDLQQLFAKLYPVHEVYIPAATTTGIHRDFAIVNVSVNEDQAKNCIKILNGSMWKGSKLKLEIAREFYQDKLNQERLSAVETISEEEKGLMPIVSVDPLPVVLSRDTIVLRHGTREYEISMKPALYSPSMIGRDGSSNSSRYQSTVVDNKSPRVVIPCGMKRVFNDDDYDEDDEANALKSISYLAPEASQLNQKRDHHLAINSSKRVGSSLTSNLNHHGGKVDEELPPAKKARSTAPIGGGVRRGFGSLLLSAELHKETKDVVSCCIDKTVDDDISKYRGGGIAKTLDGGMSSDDDDEPCVRQEDLDDAALTAERNRALSIFRDMFANDDVSVTDNKNNSDDISHHHDPSSSLSIDKQHSDAMLLSKDGYANVDQLKSIFHRDGGVWWGDDGTMKQAVRRGEAALDPMFLEAERRGIELRPHRASSTADAVTGVSDGVSDKLLSDNGLGDSKSMVFSFFAADEPIDHDAHLHGSDHKQQGDDNIDRQGTNSSDVLHTNIASDIRRDATQQQQQQQQQQQLSGQQQQQQVNTEHIVLHWTLSELIQMAKSFSRSKASIEQVTEDWKVEREKLKIDYKRKMRDFKRRTASWSNEKTAGVGAAASRSDRSSAVEVEHDSNTTRNPSGSRYSGNKTHHSHSRGRRKGKK